jgi:hypothetical protein
VTKQLFAAALCRVSRACEYCFPQFPRSAPLIPVGASLLAKAVVAIGSNVTEKQLREQARPQWIGLVLEIKKTRRLLAGAFA